MSKKEELPDFERTNLPVTFFKGVSKLKVTDILLFSGTDYTEFRG